MRSILVAVSTALLAGCATPSAPEPTFRDRYVGTAGSATLQLDLLRELPRTPEAGWLDLSDQAVAIGRFQAVQRRPIKFELTPVYVSFYAERPSDHPAAKYYWRDGTLVICMLHMAPAVTKKGNQLALLPDYETCAPMARVANGSHP